MSDSIPAIKAEDLLRKDPGEPGRITVDGHTLGYINSPGRYPRIEGVPGGYRLVLKRVLGEEAIEAPSLDEALRLLIHYNASLKSPGVASMTVSRARALASLSPRLRPELVALAAYTLALYPAVQRGGNLDEITLGGATANSVYATPAASVARLLERARPAAGRRLLELSQEIRRRIPVRASRLLSYIGWRMGVKPPYPTLLLIYLALGARGYLRGRGPLYRLPALAEASHAQGWDSVGVEPVDPGSAMSLSSLSELLMPSQGSGGVEPIVGSRVQLLGMVRRGVLDPLGSYRVTVVGGYAGVVPSEEAMVYYSQEPASSFRALVYYRRLSPCRPRYRRLDELLRTSRPC